MSINNKASVIAKQLNIIDDTLFEKMAEDEGFCEELISTILQEEVKVLRVIPQDSIKNLQGRSVVLDALCEFQDGRTGNVEVEKSTKHNHFNRVRYNTSCITANITDPGVDFEDVPTVIAIYISNFDIFKAGKPLYHIKRIVEETGEECYNGLEEIYVNAKARDESDISELMKIFTQQENYNYEKFPRISKRKHQFLGNERGEKQMCELVENFAKEYAEEYALERDKLTAMNLFENGVAYDIVKKTMKHISEEELKAIYEKYTSEKGI